MAPKPKEIHFKIMNEIYPSAEFLRHCSGLNHKNCSFCDENTETTGHLFYDCKFTNSFCDNLCYWLFPKFEEFSELKKKMYFLVCLLKTHYITWK